MASTLQLTFAIILAFIVVIILPFVFMFWILGSVALGARIGFIGVILSTIVALAVIGAPLAGSIYLFKQ